MFLLPAALPGEKEGTFTNTHRLIQWHDKVVEPPGDSRSETVVRLPSRQAAQGALRRQRRAAGRADPQPDLGLPDARPARRALGRGGAEGDQRLHVAGARSSCPASTTSRTTAPPPAAAGSTAASIPRADTTAPARGWRTARTGRAPTWTGASPGPPTAALLYNRASADPEGKPWSERKTLRLVGRGAGQLGQSRTTLDFPPTSRRAITPDWSQKPTRHGRASTGSRPSS